MKNILLNLEKHLKHLKDKKFLTFEVFYDF